MSSAPGQTPLWEPSAADRERAEMTRFMRWAAERSGREFADYDELWRWSVEELEDFWASIWEFCGVRASKTYEQVLLDRHMPGAVWFEGAELNYAENMLRDRSEIGARSGARRDPAALAVLHSSELRELGELTWGELTERVAAAAGGLRSLGVERGDRVVAYMPNIPETLIAFLAVASIGAIWSSAAPEFGARSVIDRFAQIEPKVLLTVDGYRHGGKDFDRTAVVQSILEELPTVQHAVLLPYLSEGAELDGALGWDELLARGEGVELAFEQVPFDHPLWVLYSSGTTGLPKAIVQGHGGILIEQLKKSLHLDLRPGDRMFWFTTTGWMMWNFLVGCLLSDAAIVLYDGSPAHPDLGALWSLAERAGITCMGVSAGLLASCEKAGVEPGPRPRSARPARDRLDRLAARAGELHGSTSTSARTSGCSRPAAARTSARRSSPAARCCRCTRANCSAARSAARWSPGTSRAGPTSTRSASSSSPSRFPRCRCSSGATSTASACTRATFAMYPGIWRHGDWIRITPRGGAVIYGRSDSTINRQGVRMGTSEIYRAASACRRCSTRSWSTFPPGAAPASCAWCCSSCWRPGQALDDELAAQIKRRIREDCSPRHVPNEIRQIEEVPRTLSGKVLEVPVKRILMGAPAQRGRQRRLARQPALARLLRGAGPRARPATRRLARRALSFRFASSGAEDACTGRRRPARHRPSERPTISFMISLVPP